MKGYSRISIVFMYQFTAEAVVFYLLLSLFPMVLSLPSFTSYLLYTIVALLLYTVFHPESSTPVRLLLLIISLLGAGYWSGLSLLPLSACGAFFLWRLFLHSKEDDLENERVVLIFAAILAFVHLLLYDRPVAAGALLFAYALIWIGHVTANLSQGKGASRRGSLRNVLIYSSIMAGFYAVITGMYPLFNRMVTLLLKGMLYGLTVLFTGFLYLLSFFGVDMESAAVFRTNPFEQMNWNETEFHQMINEESGADGSSSEQVAETVEWWGYGIAVMFILVMIIFLYKRWNQKNEGRPKKNEWTYTPSMPRTDNTRESIQRTFRRSSSSGFVRKHFRHFEKEAEKLGFPRYTYESAASWFHRIDLSKSVIEVYEKVRYGGMDLTDQEKKRFADTLAELKKQLAERKEV